MNKSTWLLIGLIVGSVAEHNLNKVPEYAQLFGAPSAPEFVTFPEDQKGALLQLIQGDMMRYSANPKDNHVLGEQAFQSAAKSLMQRDICLSSPSDDATLLYMKKCSNPLAIYRVTIPVSMDGHIMEPLYY